VSARTFAVFMGVIALIALLAFGLVSKGEARLETGDQVPATELTVLGGAAGETASLADYEGEWVLINVWASWCAPCRDEAPALQAFYEEHGGERFEVLGIDTQETGEGGLGFVDEYGLTYPQLHDGDGAYAKDDLKTTGVPESFLVDPEGQLALAIPGAITAEQLDQRVAPLIEEG
jgi:cytochrome c biogenesis protein CcmG, thiol:disulfide interchange protein DsbE